MIRAQDLALRVRGLGSIRLAVKHNYIGFRVQGDHWCCGEGESLPLLAFAKAFRHDFIYATPLPRVDGMVVHLW